jgi:YHS domain-containing protein
MAVDPVCGMEVEESSAAGVSEYQGKRYYFCSTGCKEEFDRNPELFIRQQGDHGMPTQGH